MVEVVYDSFLLSFLIRLGTTTIGIVVSTLVNMFVLPPNYIKEIQRNIKNIYQDIGNTLDRILEPEINFKNNLLLLNKKLDTTEKLIRFQQEGSHFQPFAHLHNEKDFSTMKKQLNLLRLIHYHLSNIENLHIHETNLKRVNVEVVSSATKSLSNYIIGNEKELIYHHEEKLRKLMDLFWRTSAPSSHTNQTTMELPKELTLLYELISIFYIVKQLDEKGLNVKKTALD